MAITADGAGRPSNDGDGGILPASVVHVDFQARPMRQAAVTTTTATAMSRRRRPSRRRLLALLIRATNPVQRPRSPCRRMTPFGRRRRRRQHAAGVGHARRLLGAAVASRGGDDHDGDGRGPPASAEPQCERTRHVTQAVLSQLAWWWREHKPTTAPGLLPLSCE